MERLPVRDTVAAESVPVKVGLAENTTEPEPVSSVRVEASSDEAPETAKLPDPSVVTKRDAVSPEAIVPENVGEEMVGEVPNTNAPLPVSSLTEAAMPADVQLTVSWPPVVVHTARVA